MPELVEVTAVRNGGKDYIVVPTETERWIAALLDDRAKYIVAGHLDLIPGIDATLAHHGYRGRLPAYGKATETKRNGGQ